MSERRSNYIIFPGLDLYDHQELRSRFLLFIHDLLQSLRSSGVCLFNYAGFALVFPNRNHVLILHPL